MKVTLLGTGTSQGVPVIGCDCEVCQSKDARDKRLRCSALVEWHGLHILVDIGPDFRYQTLRANIPKIDAILLTHEHNDHIIGLDDVRPFNFRHQMHILHGELPILGYQFGDFTYLTDVKTLSPQAIAQVKHSKILVLNALHHKPHHSHLNLEEALELIELLQPEKTYLLHISHRMGRYEEIGQLLPKGVYFAYDGLELILE